MNHLTKTKVSLYLAVIFIAGSVTGAVFGWSGGHHRAMKPPSPTKICDHIREQLRTELNLTPAQVQKLDPLLEKQVKQMEEIHTRIVQQLNELISASNAEIADVLNLSSEQRDKLAAMEKRRQAFSGKHSGHGPPPPP